MGFGKKTDPSAGITIDLDQSYKYILQPAALQAGFDCIRAAEINDSGGPGESTQILLLQADLVIADTARCNTKVLHALVKRQAAGPFSTIILKGPTGKIPAVSGLAGMLTYALPTEEIDAYVADRCQRELLEQINSLAKQKGLDNSAGGLNQEHILPTLPDEQYHELINDLADRERAIFSTVEKATRLIKKESNFREAAIFWRKATRIAPGEPYFIKQLALSIYKSKYPNPSQALAEALNSMNRLNGGETATDPETLGITGAIYKNLWLISKNLAHLDEAIAYYGRGYKMAGDYYNGENYALCLDMKSKHTSNNEEKTYYKMLAKKTRESIIQNLARFSADHAFENRIDKSWMFATLAHCFYAVDRGGEAEAYQARFYQSIPQKWQSETYERNKEYLLKNIA